MLIKSQFYEGLWAWQRCLPSLDVSKTRQQRYTGTQQGGVTVSHISSAAVYVQRICEGGRFSSLHYHNPVSGFDSARREGEKFNGCSGRELRIP